VYSLIQVLNFAVGRVAEESAVGLRLWTGAPNRMSEQGPEGGDGGPWPDQDPPYPPGADGYDDEDDGGGGGGDAAFDDEELDDEFDEDPKEMMQEVTQNPRFARVLDALREQEQNTNARLALELQEVDEDLKRTTAQREQAGVEMYGVQQQLAKLQGAVENTHTNFNMLSEYRLKEEEALAVVQKEFSGHKESLRDEKKALYKNQSELDALSATLQQVELYNEEMKSEIAVTRRATNKAEENVSQIERVKKGQDVYIDKLNEQAKSLDEQLALYEAQLIAQRKETGAAHGTLADAGAEMESVSFEKKQLLQQWKSSLIGMQRRDEALQATFDALQKQKEQEAAIESEAQGYKKSIRTEEGRKEVLEAVIDRIDTEMKFVQDQVEAKRAETRKLQERFAMLQRSMAQTDEEQSKVVLHAQNLGSQVGGLDQNVEVVNRERQKLEEQILAQQSTQTTMSKAAKNMAKSAAELQSRIHEKEIEKAAMENELARVKVDSLNTDAHNMQLRDTLSKLVAELKEKDGLIEKYQVEIRQRNDEIEKKMYRVDRLNRKYETLTKGVEDEESSGPLEAMIANLKKNLDTNQAESLELQREWLTSQTALVNATAEKEAVTDAIQELSSRVTITSQKKARLLVRIEKGGREIAELEKGMGAMRTDMAKLNSLASEHQGKQTELVDTNYAMEMEFVAELKEMEQESGRLEGHVADVKIQKKAIVGEIVEAERQIMLWEKKVQLEKEMRAALDPEVGQAETRSMEKEIHRMKLRHETLERDQERMVKEMERAIYKREALSLKYRGSGKKAEEQGLTQHGLVKQTSKLKAAIKKMWKETAGYEAAIKEKNGEMEAVGGALEDASSRYGKLEEDANELQNTINDSLYEKQRNIDRLAKVTALNGRYRAVLDAEEDPVPEAMAATAKEEARVAGEQLDTVRGLINTLRVDFPHLDEVLTRVAHLADE